MEQKLCSKCQVTPARAGQRYCRECANEWMRNWRRTHPMTEEERRHDITRSYTSVLVKRGRLIKQPCYYCGAEKVEAHHPDYAQPANVVWVCRPHHMRLHGR